MVINQISVGLIMFGSSTTLLHLLANIPFHRVLKRLINRSNALVLGEDVDGNTPLHLAAQKGMKYAAQLLMESHANVDTRLYI